MSIAYGEQHYSCILGRGEKSGNDTPYILRSGSQRLLGNVIHIKH